MGAFFLYRETASLCLDEARQVFSRKGFQPPREFSLGPWRLWLYRKMLAETDNFVQRPDGSAVFACGTVAYRGLGYRATLERLVQDHQAGTVRPELLVGNYALLFWSGQALELLVDPLHAQHLFVNDARTSLSSSFLATLAASPQPLRLNRSAAYEKLVTGSILSPDTLVEGIQQLDDDLLDALPRASGIAVCKRPCVRPSPEPHAGTFQASVERQLAVLRQYFHDIGPLAEECGAELGLSSGYDSRLILALSRFLPSRIPLHSHHTVGVHEAELAIARELARVGGNELTVVPTTPPWEMDEDRLRQMIADCLYYFDGRCLHDMGAFSETYTAAYRQRVVGSRRLSLHGLGGETYRNVYFTPQRRFRWRDWAECSVFYPFAREVCGSADVFHETASRIEAKAGRRLGIDLSGTADFHAVRCYYALVRMPDFACNVSNAYNQSEFVLTPFIEPSTVQEAIPATPHIGVSGVYEAAMIRTLAPELASVNSQYGHALNAIPFRYAAHARLVSWVPLRLRTTRLRRVLADARRNRSLDRLRRLRKESATIREIEEGLRVVAPAADWDLALCSYTQMMVASSVGSLVRAFGHKLRF